MNNGQPVKRFRVNIERYNFFISVVVNGNLVLSSFIFIIALTAPLFGGKWLPKALIVYASWIVWALIGKFLWGRMYKKIRLKVYEFVLICFCGVICMFLWFPHPLSIVFSVLFVLVGLVSYKAQLKSWDPRKTSDDKQEDLHA
jgi:chromate transport protein ChrA